MYQNQHHQQQQPHSPSLLISSPAKYNESLLRSADDVSSLGQVVKKCGLIDSSNFLQSDFVRSPKVLVPDHQQQQQQSHQSQPATTKAQSRSEPIDIPKAGQRQTLPYHYDDDFREGEYSLMPACAQFPDDRRLSSDPLPSYCEIADTDFVCNQIAEQIEAGIKRAKGTTLDCSEVLIPLNLMRQVAEDIVCTSEVEPTGLRGCLLYIGLEDHSKELRRIGCLRPISQLSNPVPTFELYLTLKQAHSGWLHHVSHKVLGRKSLVISDQYLVSKKKLWQ